VRPRRTFEGNRLHPARARVGQATRSKFARLGAAIVIASRKPEHLEAGQKPSRPSVHR